ncbi:MAG: hypothetical protein KC506_00810 [Nanoarchaeota archaeon]|nr:hypothetical protein [Nanoarchaeota archaeon]
MKNIDVLTLPDPIFSLDETVVSFDVERVLFEKDFKLNSQARVAVRRAIDRGHKTVIWSTSHIAVEELRSYGEPFTEVDQTISGLHFSEKSGTAFKNLYLLQRDPTKIVGIEDSDIFFEPLNRVVKVDNSRDLLRAECEANQILAGNQGCTHCKYSSCRYGASK